MKRIVYLFFCLIIATFAGETAASQIIYVKKTAQGTGSGTSWENAYRELRDALNDPKVSNGTQGNPVEILVAKGVYAPTGGTNRNEAFVLKNYVRIRGGFAGDEQDINLEQRPFSAFNNFVVLSGDIGVPQPDSVTPETSVDSVSLSDFDPAHAGFKDNSYNVVKAIGATGVILEFVTVTGGNANYDGFKSEEIEAMAQPDPNDVNKLKAGTSIVPLDSRVAGSGVFISDPNYSGAISVSLLNCKFINNASRGYGGAVAVKEGKVRMHGATFRCNVAGMEGGALWTHNGFASAFYSNFEDNVAGQSGGAISYETVPSSKNTFPGLSDTEVQAVTGMTRQDLQRMLGIPVKAKTMIMILDTAVERYYTGESPLTTKLMVGMAKAKEQLGATLKPAERAALTTAREMDAALAAQRSTATGGRISAQTFSRLSTASTVISGAYTVASIAVGIGDTILLIPGVDNNTASARGWQTFSGGFNTYATPNGLAELAYFEIRRALGKENPEDKIRAYALELRAKQLSFYNKQPYSDLYGCSFKRNSAGASGGAIVCARDNIQVESCVFEENTANTGGALSLFAYNYPVILNSRFSYNVGRNGYSTILSASHADAQIANCTIVNNMGLNTNGFAVGIELGSSVQIANTILWGNTDPAKPSGGADILTMTRALLDEAAAQFYDAGRTLEGRGSYVDWVGRCEISHCCVQSLNELPAGACDFPYARDMNEDASALYNTFPGPMLVDMRSRLTQAEARGLPNFFYNLYGPTILNVGEGNRFNRVFVPGVAIEPRPGHLDIQGILTKGTDVGIINEWQRFSVRGNTDQNPLLTQDYIPSRESPCINSGSLLLITNGVVEFINFGDINERSRVVANSQQVNSGSGIDMGAFERHSSDADEEILLVTPSDRPPYQSGGATTVRIPKTIHVRSRSGLPGGGTSWADSIPTLHSALAVAQSGDQIWVADQTSDGFFEIPDGVQVYGGFVGTETSLVERNWTNNTTTLTRQTAGTVVSMSDSSSLDGFTIRNGLDGVVLNNARATIRNCTIKSNTRGIRVSVESHLNLINCVIEDNDGATLGAGLYSEGQVRATGCKFEENKVRNVAARGGAVCLKRQSGNPSALFDNCVFNSNRILGGDSASLGGAIYSEGFELVLRNCTMANNYAELSAVIIRGGGAIHFSPGQQTNFARAITIANSILWNNHVHNASGPEASKEFQQVLVESGAAISISSSIIEGLSQLPASNSDSIDPHFMALNGWDLRLQSYSRAIDAGDAATVTLPKDAAGNPRFFNGIDIGAYEFQGANTAPQSQIFSSTPVCSENGYCYGFTVSFPAGTPALSGLQWLENRNDGNGFSAIANSAIFNGANSNHLALITPPFSMNGRRYRLQGFAGGVPFATAAVTLTAKPPVLFVNINASGTNSGLSWEHAFTNLADAVEAAAPCSQIWMARGTYLFDGLPLQDNLRIFGGFVGYETSVEQRSLMFHNSSTIVKGHINLGFGSNRSTVFDNLIFTRNGEGAERPAISIHQSTVAIRNCIFSNNVAQAGGAISATDSAKVEMLNCIVRRNSSGSGGGIHAFSSVLYATNCLFVENVSSHTGGAVQLFNSMSQLINCTIAQNEAATDGGGVSQSGGTNVVRNSILWGNKASLIYSDLPNWQINLDGPTDVLQLEHCLVQGMQNEMQNLWPYDPLFVAPLHSQASQRSWNLVSASPAIGIGSVGFASSAPDLDLNPRIRGGTNALDLGAYQFQGSPTNAITLTESPQAVTVCTVAGVTRFTIATATNPPPSLDPASFVWEKLGVNGFEAITNANYSVLVTPDRSTLTISNVSLGMNGSQIRVRLTNVAYTTTPVTLTVLPPSIIYVNAAAAGAYDGSSWTNAFNRLQDALAVADQCSEIWVARGTYICTNQMSLRRGVPVYGGFAGHETNLGQRIWSQNPSLLVGVVTDAIFYNSTGPSVPSIDQTAILDGFTFIATNGANAIYNYGASPTIQNCVFSGAINSAINNNLSGGTISNCFFIDGHETAIQNFSSSPAILNCTFVRNRGDYRAGAILNQHASSPRVIDCLFENNSASIGGAVENNGDASPVFVRCRFFGNSASDGGGAIYNESGTTSASFQNCLFYNNNAGFRGGAIYHVGSSLNLVNCTLVRNTSVQLPAGIYGSGITVLNSILWDNQVFSLNGTESAVQMQIKDSGDLMVISNSCVMGISPLSGSGNLRFDPLFVDPITTDFSLSASSPCVNAGNSSYLTTTELDLVRKPRFVGVATDMGAYELQTAASAPIVLLKTPESVTECAGSTAVFNLLTENSSSPTNFVWQRAYNNYSPEFQDVPTNDGMHGLTISGSTLSLHITNVPLNGIGRFFRVRTVDGNYVSGAARLTVEKPGIVYVNASASGTNDGSSWDNAFTNLQVAISASGKCSELWVAAGTYAITPRTDGSLSFSLRNGMRLFGGFAGTETALIERNWQTRPTILQGVAGGFFQDPVFDNRGDLMPIDASAVLDGFIVRAVTGQSGMANRFASPTVRNCVFENIPGTGILNDNSSPLISNCTFTNNSNHAIQNQNGSSPVITNSLFVDNTSQVNGGAIENVQGSSPRIERCRFYGNNAPYSGGAIFNDASSFGILNSTFIGNSANSGGAVFSRTGSALSLTNCVLAKNVSTHRGGAIEHLGAPLTMVNCTVADNIGANSGGGIYKSGGTYHARNSIFWNNRSSESFATVERQQIRLDDAMSSVEFCDIEGKANFSSGSNLSVTPLFNNPGTNDYSLPGKYSPLVNIGDNAAVAGVVTDVSGFTGRVRDNQVDIGAYESTFTGVRTPIEVFSFTGTTAVCDQGVATYSVTSAANVNFVWEIDSGSGFVKQSPEQFGTLPLFQSGVASVTEIPGSNTLKIFPVSTSMNGWKFRLRGASPLTGFTSETFTLSVSSRSLVYVNPLAGGTGDGTSWENAFTNLQTALRDSSCTDIWVKAGTYTYDRGTNSNVFLEMKSGVTLYGGFAGNETNREQRNWTNQPTILQTSPGVSLVYNNGHFASVDDSAILDGFVVTGNSSFAAIRNENGATPGFRNCTFTNLARGVYNLSAGASFSNCTFVNNSDAGIINENSKTFVSNCGFSGNRTGYRSASILNGINSTVTVRSSSFWNNSAAWGAAIYNGIGASARISHSTFLNNVSTANGGAIYNDAGSEVTLVTSLLAGNSSDARGGAVAHHGSQLALVNCTITENSAAVSGGGLFNEGSGLAATNCVFWRNSITGNFETQTLEETQVYTETAGSSIVQSVVQGLAGFVGNGNVAFDPLFKDRANGDWRLIDSSPAADSGMNVGFSLNDVDLAGQPRVRGPAVDMGAYEEASDGRPARFALSSSSITQCEGTTARFTVRKAPGYSYSINWEKKVGESFQIIHNGGQYTIETNADSSTLVFTNLTSNLSGTIYRFSIRESDGTAYDSPELLLTVGTPMVLHVNRAVMEPGNGQTWTNAFATIQEAVAIADSCTEIWVAGGGYTLTNDMGGGESMTLRSGVRIFGGFAGHEVSRGERNWTNHPTVLRAGPDSPVFRNYGMVEAIDSTAVLDGFTITGSSDNAVAMENLGASPTILNCTFESNTNSAVRNNYGAALFSNCVFRSSGFESSVVMNLSGASPTFIKCTFENNISSSQGAALFNGGISAVLKDCVFRGNTSSGPGGAIANGVGADLSLNRCSFIENSSLSSGGALLALGGTIRIQNSLFVGNSSGHQGGGISSSAGSTMAIVNCTFARNSAAITGGGLYQQLGTAGVTNSIFWGNSHRESGVEAAQLYAEFGGVIHAHWSCIQGLNSFAGNGNIQFDPLFTAPESGDFTIVRHSPALNVGNNSAVSAATDLVGSPRIWNSIVDMGAYESTLLADTIRLYSQPTSSSACVGGTIELEVQGSAGLGSSVNWLSTTGTVFAPLPSDGRHAVVTNSTSSTLIIANAGIDLNGRRYQFHINGTTYDSAPITLTVGPRSVIYVKANAVGANDGSSWANAFTNLQSALPFGHSCAEIWVARGIYAPPTFSMKSGLRLFGGFAGTETLLSQRNFTTNHTVLLGHGQSPLICNLGDRASIDRTAILDGFVLRGGTKAAVFNSDGASPTIRNCTFEDATYTALFNWNASSPWIENCIFTNNSGGAVQNLSPSFRASTTPVVITNCVFVDNAGSSGVAIYNSDATVEITHSRFERNRATSIGGAVIFDGEGESRIDWCRFIGNEALQGAAVHVRLGASATTRNSLYEGNKVSYYGGSLFNDGALNIINCTIVNNRSRYHGAGVGSTADGVTIRNSILWNNTAEVASYYGFSVQKVQMGSLLDSPFNVENSCVEGLESLANGNIRYNPLFVDPLAGDWRLDPSSACIDAGANAHMTSATDLGNQPRSVYGIVDMGAFEAQFSTHSPALIAQLPESRSACESTPVQFMVSGDAQFQWQYNNGAGWSSVLSGSNATDFALPNATTLLIANPTDELNGCQFRVYLPEANYFSPAATLSISSPEIIFVNAAAPLGGNGETWGTAYNDLQTALAATVLGDCRRVIWVAAGVYRPGLAAFPQTLSDRSISFVIPSVSGGIQIYGGFSGTETDLNQRNWRTNLTILSGAIGAANVANDDAYNVVNFDATPRWLLGFATFFEAAGPVEDQAFFDRIYAWLDGVRNPVTSATIMDGFVIEHSTTSGVNVWQSSPAIRNCVLRSHNGSSAMQISYSSPGVENCSFVENTIRVAPLVISSSLQMPDVQGVSSPEILGCIFSGNTSSNQGGAGGIFLSANNGAEANASASVINTVITGNKSFGLVSAAAVRIDGGSLSLDNCTVSGNHTLYALGGALIADNANVAVRNSIFWDNRVADTDEAPNVAFDPLFVEGISPADAPTTNGNFRLQSCSPLIDTGANSVVAGIFGDQAGAPRIVGTVDLGAYEFQGVSSPALAITVHPVSRTFCGGGSNVFSVATPNSNVTFQWETDRLDGNGFVSVVEDAMHSGSSTAVLSINDATLAMNGTEYRCSISSANGCVVRSKTATLSVGVPRFYVNAAAADGGDGFSWETAFDNLGDALRSPLLDTCSPGTEIWVAAGTYTPTQLPMQQVRIYGGFNGTETSLGQRDWTNHLTTISGDSGGVRTFWNGAPYGPVIGVSARLDGFTLDNVLIYNATNCGPTFANCKLINALVNSDAGSPRLENCELTGRSVVSSYYGGAPVITNCVFRHGSKIESRYGTAPLVLNSRFLHITNNPAVSTSDGNLTMRHCEFVGDGSDFTLLNIAAVNNSGSDSVIEDCVFTATPGAILNRGIAPKTSVIRRSRFAANTYTAVAHRENISALLEDCVFTRNLNGGMSLSDSSGLISRCEFLGNQAGSSTAEQGGGLIVNDATVVIANSRFSGNLANHSGGGISVNGSNVEIYNCTITGNRAAPNVLFDTNAIPLGAGIDAGSGSLKIYNSVIWGNIYGTSDDRWPAQVFGPSELIRNNIQNISVPVPGCGSFCGFTGSGNTDFDPLFIQSASAFSAPSTNGNLRLHGSSPLINAGTNGATASAVIDLDGEPRFSGIVDIGAYEFQGTPAVPLFVTTHPASITYCSSASNFFHVIASGTGLSYQWQVNRNDGAGFVDLIDDAGIVGSEADTLVLSNASPAWNGFGFRCVISSTTGVSAASRAATLTVYLQRLYVRAEIPNTGDGLSWETAYKTLSEALNNPLRGCDSEIWVAQGMYYPDATGFELNANHYQFGSVSIYGGFSGTETNLNQRDWTNNPAVLSGDVGIPGDRTDNRNTLFAHNFGTYAVSKRIRLDGLVLENAGYGIQNSGAEQMVIANCSVRYLGTGIQNSAGKSMLIQNSTFISNSTAMSSISGSATIQSSSFTQNTNAISTSSGTALFIADCLFDQNIRESVSASGGLTSISGSQFSRNAKESVLLVSGSLQVTACLFAQNLFTPMSVNNAGPAVVVSHSEFRGNVGAAGALSSFNSSGVEVNNCLFSGNVATNSGVIVAQGPAFTVRNSTIAANSGAGIYLNASLALYNSIVWGNSTQIQVVSGGIGVDANNSIGDLPGNDPKFVEQMTRADAPTIEGDYRLAPCSPLINAGGNSFTNALLDLAGLPRVFGASVDIGAYELQGTPTQSFVLSEHPTHQSGNEGAIIHFKAASIENNVTYRWQVKRGAASFADLQENATYLGTTNSVLTVVSPGPGMDGEQYRCKVRDAGGCSAYSTAGIFRYGFPFSPVVGTNLVWRNYGVSGWIGQTNVTRNGAVALEAALQNGEETTLEITVTGPAVVSWWWKSAAPDQMDGFEAWIGDFPSQPTSANHKSIYGNVDWTQQNFRVNSGSQRISWRYSKYSAAANKGWLSEIVVNRDPEILVQPASQSLLAGGDVSFNAVGSGTLPLSVQWRRNGTNISGANGFTYLSTNVLGGSSPESIVTISSTYSITNADANQSGEYSLLLNGRASVASSNAVLTVVPVIPLGEALDATQLTFASGGSKTWYGQTNVSHFGNDAAQTRQLSNSQDTWIETQINGPATLTFWWKVSSATNSDFLELWLDSALQQRISGAVDWQQVSIPLQLGTRVVRWRYVKDGAGNAGMDAAWIDQVVFTPASLFSLAVTNTHDGGPGSFRQALLDASQAGAIGIPSKIDLTAVSGTIYLSNALPIITNTVSINGSGSNTLTIHGNDLHRVFFVDAATHDVEIKDLTISHGRAKGGNGANRAGGGAGLGGGLFVNAGNVTLQNVAFSNNSAVGGNGGNGQGGPGGGGGLGGNGGGSNGSAGGGGGGFLGNGGEGNTGGGGGGGILGHGGNGAGSGFSGGGGGGGLTDGNHSASSSGGTGGLGGGKGADSSSGTAAQAGSRFGGGGGGSGFYRVGANGGAYGAGGGGSIGGSGGAAGDFGGGGGNGDSTTSLPYAQYASGGFGGGGGSGSYNQWNLPGGNGGFGAGGGGGPGINRRGNSLAFGGSGGYPISTAFGRLPGGGGAALGASLFVRGDNGATLTMVDSTTDEGSLTAGAAGVGSDVSHNPAQPGQASGSSIFLLGGTNTFDVTSGTNTIPGSIGGWAGAPGSIEKLGAGTLILNGSNSYSGATLIRSGEVRINGDNSASSNTIVFAGASLSGTGSVNRLTLNSSGVLAPGPVVGTLNSGNTIWLGSGNYIWKIHHATNPPGIGAQLLNVNGTLDLSQASGFNIVLRTVTSVSGEAGPAAQFDYRTNHTWVLAQASGGILGFNAVNFILDTSGFANGIGSGQFQLTLSGDSRQLLLRFETSNREPIPANDFLVVTKNHTMGAATARLLANDSDVDGDVLTISAVSSTSTNGGSVVLSDGLVIYRPVSEFIGTDAFNYAVVDGYGGSASATVVVYIVAGEAALSGHAALTNTDGKRYIRFNGSPGQAYRLQYADDPEGPWTIASQAVTAGPNGLVEFEDLELSVASARFYRIIAP